MFKEYDQNTNKDVSENYKHVMGWTMTNSEYIKFMPALMRKIAPFMSRVSFFYTYYKKVSSTIFRRLYGHVKR